MQLNKYLALSGVTSRRNAVELIKEGFVKINGIVEKNPAYRVKDSDKVTFKDKLVKPTDKIYILLNKPAGYITTRADELGRRTVMDLLKGIPKLVHPIGRLDKETTGVLILTNDGDLTQKLAHPRFNIEKTYSIKVNKPLEYKHIQEIIAGIILEDGFIKPDKLAYRNDLATITLHSGRKRIVRRIFEHFGYRVKKLDRINFAGITKKGLPRGRWRYLTSAEIKMLKNL